MEWCGTDLHVMNETAALRAGWGGLAWICPVTTDTSGIAVRGGVVWSGLVWSGLAPSFMSRSFGMHGSGILL